MHEAHLDFLKSMLEFQTQNIPKVLAGIIENEIPIGLLCFSRIFLIPLLHRNLNLTSIANKFQCSLGIRGAYNQNSRSIF